MIFKHLLPRAKAWTITPVLKYLTKFFEALESALMQFRLYVDQIYNDLRPETTRDLNKWEDQFYTPNSNMTDTDRRLRLAATWQAMGGQTKEYIQATLQAAGFPVYVHDWWYYSSGVLTIRDPNDWLTSQGIDYIVRCGEPLARCGEPSARAGEYNVLTAPGYALVNKLQIGGLNYNILCGEAGLDCGEAGLDCGEYDPGEPGYITYIPPTDADHFPYFMYIGGETFGDVVNIPAARKSEFENLILKLRPLNLWVGMFITYS